MQIRILGLSAALLMMNACRTSDNDKDVKAPIPLLATTASSDPVLKKVIGDLTKKYPENREQTCTIVRGDVTNLKDIDLAIAAVSKQALADAFIFRAQIPSIQYFGYLNGEAVLLSEAGDEKMRFRRPEGELGNPNLDLLMKAFESACGVDDATP